MSRLEDLINVGKESFQLGEVETSAGRFQLERPGSEYLLQIEAESDPAQPTRPEGLRLRAESAEDLPATNTVRVVGRIEICKECKVCARSPRRGFDRC